MNKHVDRILDGLAVWAVVLFFAILIGGLVAMVVGFAVYIVDHPTEPLSWAMIVVLVIGLIYGVGWLNERDF